MRALLGPVAAHLALAGAGMGILRALGVIDRLALGRVLAAGGLAYLVGIAATLSICVAILVAGGPFTLPVFAVVASVLAAPLALELRPAPRRPAPGSPPVRPSSLGWIAIATLIAFALLAAVGLATLGGRPFAPHDVDGWNQWTRKALLLTDSPHLPTQIFAFSGELHPDAHYNINPSYPLALPLLEALHMRALGRPDAGSAHLVVWLLSIAFVWAGGFIARRVTPAVVWAPVLCAAVVLSGGALITGYADVPMGYYLALGALLLGMWLRSGAARDLGPAMLLLAGAAQIKNEGTVAFLLATLAALAIVLASGRRRAALQLVVAAGLAAAIAILPWRLWIALGHFQTEEPLRRVLSPGFLGGHAGRIGPTVSALLGHLGPVGIGGFAWIAAPAVATCLMRRGRRALAAFYAALGAGYLVALAWAFWISTLETSFLIRASASRIVVGVAFISLAAALQLTAPERPAGGPALGPVRARARRTARRGHRPSPVR